MNYRPYRFQITVVVVAGILILVSYRLILLMVDSIMADYEVYSSVKDIAQDPGSIDRQWEELSLELNERRTALDEILSREKFSQDIFRYLAPQYGCRLVKFENRDVTEKGETEYNAIFSGPVKGLLDLLDRLETGYYVRIDQVSLAANNEAGTVVRMALIMTAGEHEI